MSTPKRGYTGRYVLLEYSLQPPETDIASLTFTRLGMKRDLTHDTSWDTADATGDTSPNFTKENLVTFKEESISGSYVSMATDIEGQKAFASHVRNPPVSTGGQPYVWFRETTPMDITIGNFLVSNLSTSSPYSDTVTTSFESISNGIVEYTDVT